MFSDAYQVDLREYLLLEYASSLMSHHRYSIELSTVADFVWRTGHV